MIQIKIIVFILHDHYMMQCYNTSPTLSSTSSITSFTIPFNLPSLKISSSSYHDTCVGCNSHNGDDTDLDLDLVPVYFSPITSTHLSLVPSSLKPISLSSNLFYLSSDCGLVSLRYVAVALVASLTTTSFLSNFLSSTTFSSLPVLDYSFVLYWISSIVNILDTICSNSNPNDVSAFVNLHQLHLVLSLESSYFLGCFVISPISLFPLAFKIYCEFNRIALVLMIILMIMGLCCFLIMSQLPVTNWDSIQDLIQVTRCTILISLSRILKNHLKYSSRS